MRQRPFDLLRNLSQSPAASAQTLAAASTQPLHTASYAVVSTRNVTKAVVGRVSAPASVTGVVIGPNVRRIMPKAFAQSPNVNTVKVRSPHLTTKKSVFNCLKGSNVRRLVVDIDDSGKSAEVVRAFTKWAGLKPR